MICPFAGTVEEGLEVARRLLRIRLVADDTIVLVDNTPDHVLAAIRHTIGEIEIVHAPKEQSSYHARNIGAEATEGEWLLFIDADCIPIETILDEYFEEPIPADCGALAGAIAGVPTQTALAARWARARGVLDQERLAHKDRPFGATANLMVRRAAMTEIGGFHEGIRSGGDVDFCWRLQEAGWSLVYRDGACIEHLHREDVSGLVRQYSRYGAGRSWLERRYRDEPRSRKHVALLAAAPALILGNLLAGRKERAAYRFLDAAIVAGGLWGRLLDNKPSHQRVSAHTDPRVVLIAERFPMDDTDRAVERLGQEGGGVWVEAATRSLRFSPSAVRGLSVQYLEDDGALRRLLDLGWLASRHPARLAHAIARQRGDTSYPVHAVAARARRIAARHASVVYCLSDDPRAIVEARRIGDLLDIRLEILD